MELGAGLNSTYEFFKHDIYVVSIETDESWIDKIKIDLVEDDKHKLIYHDIGYNNITRSTLAPDIPKDVFDEALKIYLYHYQKKLNMLFIDQFAGLRFHSLQNLYSKFDVIIYHDVEESHLYGYNDFIDDVGYIRIIDKTFIAWTGILIHPRMEKYIGSFCRYYKAIYTDHANKYNFKTEMQLEIS